MMTAFLELLGNFPYRGLLLFTYENLLYFWNSAGTALTLLAVATYRAGPAVECWGILGVKQCWLGCSNFKKLQIVHEPLDRDLTPETKQTKNTKFRKVFTSLWFADFAFSDQKIRRAKNFFPRNRSIWVSKYLEFYFISEGTFKKMCTKEGKSWKKVFFQKN
jgi:hypothetical protein